MVIEIAFFFTFAVLFTVAFQPKHGLKELNFMEFPTNQTRSKAQTAKICHSSTTQNQNC